LRALRVTAPCQLSLGLVDLPVSADLWQSLPEEIRCQVLGLLARLIAKGALADSGVAVEVGDA
jgi:hypothetical protein